jgi:uncharacterized membrane protein
MEQRTRKTEVLGFLATGLIMLMLDMVWLGAIAGSLYDQAFGALKRTVPYLPAAVAFYLMYATATYVHGVRSSTSASHAAARGACLGLVAYGTFELTNWAVIVGWSPRIVAIDIAWGIFLTATSSVLGFLTLGKLSSSRELSRP